MHFFSGTALVVGLQWCGLARGWAQLSKAAFEEELVANDFSLVAFVWPDQERTKIFGPEWANAFDKKMEHLVSINCETAADICQGYGVTSYPDIRLFQRDQPLESYKGSHRATAMIHYVRRMKRPVVSQVQSNEELLEFRAADETVFVAYLAADAVDGDEARAFAALAEKYRQEYTFGVVTDAAVAEQQGVSIPSVVCYNAVDGDTAKFGFDKVDGLEGWATETSRAVVGELTKLNQQRLLDRGWPMVYLFAPTQEARDSLRKKLYRFARNYYDSLTTVVVDPLEFPDLMPRLGLEAGVFPAGAVHQLSKDRVYPYPKGQPIESNALQKWGLDVYQGRIKPWTAPGARTTEVAGLEALRAATRKISMRSIPGVTIKIGGRDEL